MGLHLPASPAAMWLFLSQIPSVASPLRWEKGRGPYHWPDFGALALNWGKKGKHFCLWLLSHRGVFLNARSLLLNLLSCEPVPQ